MAPPRPSPRWWPAWVILAATGVAVGVVEALERLPRQQRHLTSLGILLGAAALLLLWWVAFSRVRWRVRLIGVGVLASVVGGTAALVRIRGVTGDLLPVLAWRWTDPGGVGPSGPSGSPPGILVPTTRPDFPGFLGPERDGVVADPGLDPDWTAHPPELLWRQPIGPGWSGFAVVGQRAVTQEQAGEEEWVSAYDVLTGRRLWNHAVATRYATTIAGEGPRATPTIHGDRVVALGANGHLVCLELASGREIWAHHLPTETGAGVPGWGYAGSPLVRDGRVFVVAGGPSGKAVVAHDLETGGSRWMGGRRSAGYSSPVWRVLGGRPHLLAFNGGGLEALDPEDGSVLWDRPFGVGQPHVAVPLGVGPDRVFISAGYGAGAELLEVVSGGGDGARPEVRVVWASNRMKAKFANPVVIDGVVYGLDDGMLAAVDLADGSRLWKEGRYGHGQGLRVGPRLLLMSESGELVLLEPTPAGPGERARFPVFSDKTWNPIALSGELLLVRNDREAACLRLPVRRPASGRP